MDEVGKSRSESSGTHIRGNLAPMIGRMHHHVQQDILLLAGAAFALGVLVGERTGKAGLAERSQVALPKPRQLLDFQSALLQREQGPNGQSLLLEQQPFQP